MGHIKDFLAKDKLRTLKVGVFGDCCLDEYYYVQANRLSPEFPIPVFLSKTEQPDHILPGMAANVAYQFRNFNTDVHLIAMVDDRAKEVYEKCGVNIEHCFPCDYDVPIKKRLYHGDFPLTRWDIEDIGSCELDPPYEDILPALMKMDLFVFSDYNKGFFKDVGKPGHHFRTLLNQDSIPTLVDPKGEDIDKWKGCTIFKPNAVEAKKLSGISDDWWAQAQYFQKRLGCQAVIITMGGSGVAGIVNGEPFQYVPKKAPDNVNSVIGAGDCFVAFVAMAVGRGFSIEKAIEIAYEAGAIYVQNKHNEPVSPHLLLAQEDPIAAKIWQPQELARTLGEWRSRTYRLVFTNGCFDILHAGHLATLKFAKSKGHKLVVAVNSDESVRRLKGPDRPIVACLDRLRLLAALDVVDYVVAFDEDTPHEVIEILRPDVLVKGGEYKRDEIVGHDIVPQVFTSPMVDGLSTSRIVERIKNPSV